MTFRSHKKGGLARYREKVDSDRVLRGDVGKKIRDALLEAGIIEPIGSFYHWNAKRADQHLGISWQHLRTGQRSPALEIYLRTICDGNPNLFE